MLNIDCQILFAIKLPVDNVSRKAGCLSNHFQFSYATLRYYESQGECGLFFSFLSCWFNCIPSPLFTLAFLFFYSLYLWPHCLLCFARVVTESLQVWNEEKEI